MIEFDESEYYHSPLGEDALRILLCFLPRDIYDTLLIGSNAHVRSYNRVRTRSLEERCEPIIDWDSLISASQAPKGERETEATLPVDVRQ